MTNAVTKRDEQPASVAEYSGGLMEVIARAARDPSVDIDKMERLIAMQERVQSRNAEVAFNAALAELQPELPVIDERGGIKDRNGNIQSTYALWEDVNEAIRPYLAKHGFALRFRVDRQSDQISVTGILSHREGHKEETTLALPTDTSGSKNAVQAVGSSTSYGKRYTAFALLNITSTGEDDDGNRAGIKPTRDAVNDDTLTSIIEYCEAVGGGQSALILTAFKVKRLDDLTQSQGEAALKRLKDKLAEKSNA
jgi:hypothetical protein